MFRGQVVFGIVRALGFGSFRATLSLTAPYSAQRYVTR